jgi:hypothetical protein
MSVTSSGTPSDDESVVVFDPKASKALKNLDDVMAGRFLGWGNPLVANSWTPQQFADSEAEVRELINELEADELARALYASCVYGDVLVAKCIWAQRGPFRIEYHEGRNGQVVINGQLAKGSGDVLDIFANAQSTKELRELFEWLPTIGMGFMVGVGTSTALLLQSDKLKSPIRNLAWSSKFTGELPILSTNGVSRPELMLALQDQADTSLFPEAFKDVLCWVDERMLDDLPQGFEPYKAMQHLRLKKIVYGTGVDYAEIPLAEVNDDLLSEVSQRTIVDGFLADSVAPWSFEALSLRTVPLDSLNTRNNAVLGYQTSEPMQHGFDHLPGHVLCRTTVDVLSQFPTGPVHADNMSKAAQFVGDYCPIDLMMLGAHQVKPMNPNCLRGNMGVLHHAQDTPYGILEFYKAFGNDSPVQSHFQKHLPAPLLKFIFDFYCTVDLDAKAMIGLSQGLGIDNTGFGLDLDYKGLYQLHEAGFRFSDESKISQFSHKRADGGHYNHRVNSVDTSVKLDINDGTAKVKASVDEASAWNNRFANALSMNLWPVSAPKPESVEKGLGKASRKKSWSSTPEESSLLAYLDQAGIETCASVAKTTGQWVFIKDHFGREAVEPYLRVMPRDARGHVLEDDMGL